MLTYRLVTKQTKECMRLLLTNTLSQSFLTTDRIVAGFSLDLHQYYTLQICPDLTPRLLLETRDELVIKCT